MVLKVQMVLDVARTSLTLIVFMYASFCDYKTREVSNNVWIIFAPIAFVLTFCEIYFFEFTQFPFYGACFGLTSIFAILIFYSGGFGGADAKALICLALALPFQPSNLFIPVSGDISPISNIFFPMTVFSNGILLAALMAIYMLSRNVFWHRQHKIQFFGEEFKSQSLGRKILILITGYKVPINKLKEKWHLYPLEDIENVEDGLNRKLLIFPNDDGRDAIVERLKGAVEKGSIQDMIWTTPGLPMLIFITVGLMIALFFGDIIWILIRLLFV
jgi:preflagellin peptidase FlaK